MMPGSRWLLACGAAVSAAALGYHHRHHQSQENPSRVLHSASCLTEPLTAHCRSSGSNTYSDTVLGVGSDTHGTCISSASAEEGRLGQAIERSRRHMKQAMMERGIPGAVVAVSKYGRLVWSEGLGYADVENDVLCTPDTVMRIASISKALTSVALLQLWQKGLVDLDAPIQTYVPEFPQKTFEGKPVEITTRQLLSHLAGIRHYGKPGKETQDKKEGKKKGISGFREYYIKSHFNSVLESLKLFAEDDLLCEPGKEFHYTTHGWTLVSAVIEKASGEDFLSYMRRHIFRPLGMTSTMGEFHKPLVYRRARHYVWDAKGRLRNTPYIDNSYKWAGGGLISSAKDLVTFGNAMLACYQLSKSTKSTNEKMNTSSEANTSSESSATQQPSESRILLQPNTVAMMWSPATNMNNSAFPELGYGMGWFVSKEDPGLLCGKRKPFLVGHTGGAVGASSVLLIGPVDSSEMVSSGSGGEAEGGGVQGVVLPQGVVVAVIFNLQEVEDVYSVGVKIIEEFLD